MVDALQQAIAEAVAEKGEAWLTEPDPAEAAATPAAPATGEGEPSKGEVPATEEASEPVTTTEEQELPTEYWGVPLEGIEPEKVREILAHFEQQDSTIRKLQEQLAAKPEAPAAPVVETPAEDVSDEDLLRAAGYDPEDFEVQNMAKYIVPSLRRELSLEDKLTSLVEQKQVEDAVSSWNKELDTLESTYGKMPFERLDVLRWAAEQQVPSPFETYFRLSAPAKREVEDVVGKARQEAAKRAASAGVKPQTSTAGAPPVTKDMSLRDAVAAAAVAAEKETGFSWKSILRGER